MKNSFSLVILLVTYFFATAQKENLPKTSAGFPINYNEDSVGTYTLPDLFTLANGQKVTTAKTWTEQRRPELLHLFETIQYGKMPAAPTNIRFNVFDKGSLVFGGKAIRKQVTVYLSSDTIHKMDILIYLPVNMPKPVPLLLNVSFVANCQAVDDAGVKIGYTWTKEGNKIKADQASKFPKMDVLQFIDAGFGFATIYYGDIEPTLRTACIMALGAPI